MLHVRIASVLGQPQQMRIIPTVAHASSTIPRSPSSIRPSVTKPSKLSITTPLLRAMGGLGGPSPRGYARGSLRVSAEASSNNDGESVPGPEYRRCVGVCVVNAEDKVFVARRADLPSVGAMNGESERVAWQMPQGGVDEGEELESAALRELKEETGMTSAHILHSLPHWVTYDFPPALMAKWLSEGRGWGGKYKGQAQRWFLLRFTGGEEEIDLSGIGEAREFTEWKWMPLEDLPEWVVPFKKDVYTEIASNFGGFLKAEQAAADKVGDA
mmetsp:Transcript_27312/g.59676  ORF Transcript_27312/g.59676 Transcript_27312/m.59676 type:complete len:271 (+) Transcript_27312:105-917(+)|eukprot:CAMPEP_0118949106 /NCGR_PEP_ID=MMETSP1169-20130426/49047_1 /TAXON_ID=36882 /ORGANISM="Pyramimonas obovata, Strain CCMP722" /LENGTH=270 /DNA_ID=CAMNT_0006895665 /DNA_START=88 /DNA_END=900 /DNA_ORIENTATION=+